MMNPDPQKSRTFNARTYPLNVYSGQNALAAMPRELQRFRVKRALVICGRSVFERTDLTKRIESLTGSSVAAVFSGITEGAPAECIEQAARVALDVRADGLIAVGAGSVIKGARVVAMLMGEGLPLQDMATRHIEGRPPVSQRLLQPKVPIFNVLTSPTSAQNRGGSAVRYHGSAHHLEFFDPKTRPRAVFWDTAALASAPLTLMRSTSFEIYWWGLMCMGAVDTANPLVQASRRQAWRLARSAYPRLGAADAGDAHIDLCAAGLLQNRDEEDGGRPWSCHLLARAAYAIAVAVFNHCPNITQSHGYAGMAPSVIRHMGHLVPEVLTALGQALGVSSGSGDDASADRIADAVAQDFAALGWQGDLSAHDIPMDDVPLLMRFALHNFNANHDRLLDVHSEALRRALEASLSPI